MNNGLATIPASPAPVGAITTAASLAFEPSDIDQAVQLAKLLVASRLLPDTLKTPEAAFTVIMTGRELGLTAMQSIRSIHVIKGKPVMSADLMVALTKRSPECEFFRLVESSGTIATYETKRRSDSAPTRMSFTIDEAKQAGLLGNDNWRKFPAAMLRARCASALCRAVFADLMLGVYETDELAPGRGVPDVEYVQHSEPAQSEPAQSNHAQSLPAPQTDHVAVSPHAMAYVDKIDAAKTREDVVAQYKAAKADADVEEFEMKYIMEACAERTEALKKAAA